MKRLRVLLTLIYFVKCDSEAGAVSSKCERNPITITLPQGKIRGSYDYFNGQIKFLGIPYASVDEKYQEPGKPPSWSGTFNADLGLVQCKQYSEQWKRVVGQEDCLVLNVFTPTHRDNKPFPVMVFIHGGGFYWGSNTDLIYNPRYLVKEGVIVVTINYRLGALGFLCLPLKEAPGNAGLKDQIAALKWIQNNIAHFGGNPDSVTLFGESSGGVSANFLIQSHSAEGLFHRTIIQSCTILTPQDFSYTPIENARKVAMRLGYNTTNPEELLKIYKNTSVDDIIRASHYDESTDNLFVNHIFGPCIETAITNRRPLITEHPKDLLQKDDLNISAIIGFNNKEGIYWASSFVPISLEKVKANVNNIIPMNLHFNNDTDKKSFVDDIMRVYFSKGSVTDNLIDYFTDSLVRYPLTIVSERLSSKVNRNIYNYYYTYDSIRNVNKLISKLSTVRGANHADELFCLFDPIVLNFFPPTARDRAMIKSMVTLWTNFAKTGEPSAPEMTWQRSGEHLKFIELGDEIKMTALPNEDRIEFWRNVYNKYGSEKLIFY